LAIACVAEKTSLNKLQISVGYIKEFSGFPDVNSKQLKFTLLDVSRGLRICEWFVSISYTFRVQSSGELNKGPGKIYS